MTKYVVNYVFMNHQAIINLEKHKTYLLAVYIDISQTHIRFSAFQMSHTRGKIIRERSHAIASSFWCTIRSC